MFFPASKRVHWQVKKSTWNLLRGFFFWGGGGEEVKIELRGSLYLEPGMGESHLIFAGWHTLIHPRPSQITKMGLFAIKVNGFKPFNDFHDQNSNLDVSQGPEIASGILFRGFGF